MKLQCQEFHWTCTTRWWFEMLGKHINYTTLISCGGWDFVAPVWFNYITRQCFFNCIRYDNTSTSKTCRSREAKTKSGLSGEMFSLLPNCCGYREVWRKKPSAQRFRQELRFQVDQWHGLKQIWWFISKMNIFVSNILRCPSSLRQTHMYSYMLKGFIASTLDSPPFPSMKDKPHTSVAFHVPNFPGVWILCSYIVCSSFGFSKIFEQFGEKLGLSKKQCLWFLCHLLF